MSHDNACTLNFLPLSVQRSEVSRTRQGRSVVQNVRKTEIYSNSLLSRHLQSLICALFPWLRIRDDSDFLGFLLLRPNPFLRSFTRSVLLVCPLGIYLYDEFNHELLHATNVISVPMLIRSAHYNECPTLFFSRS